MQADTRTKPRARATVGYQAGCNQHVTRAEKTRGLADKWLPHRKIFYVGQFASGKIQLLCRQTGNHRTVVELPTCHTI